MPVLVVLVRFVCWPFRVCVCVCVLCSWQAVGLGFKVFAFACTLEVRNTCESGAWGLGALFMWFRVMVTGWYNP